jgi:hypothetical protein
MKQATIDQIINLRKQGKTLTDISNITGVPLATIHQRLKYHDKKEIDKAFSENKAEAFEKLQAEIVKTMTSKELKEMRTKDKIQALAILNDQVRKERGLDENKGVTINIGLLNEVYERAVSFLEDK